MNNRTAATYSEIVSMYVNAVKFGNGSLPSYSYNIDNPVPIIINPKIISKSNTNPELTAFAIITEPTTMKPPLINFDGDILPYPYVIIFNKLVIGLVLSACLAFKIARHTC